MIECADPATCQQIAETQRQLLIDVLMPASVVLAVLVGVGSEVWR